MKRSSSSKAQPGRAATLGSGWLETGLPAGDPEDRPGLLIIKSLAGNESGDLSGNPLDVTGHGFAWSVLENKPGCSIGLSLTRMKAGEGLAETRVFLSEFLENPARGTAMRVQLQLRIVGDDDT